MSAGVNDASLDACLNYYANTITAIVALNAEPTTYADTQNSAYKLAQVTLTSADFAVGVGESGYQRRIDYLGKDVGSSALAGLWTWCAFINVASSLLIIRAPTLNSKSVVIGSPIRASARVSLVQFVAPLVTLVV